MTIPRSNSWDDNFFMAGSVGLVLFLGVAIAELCGGVGASEADAVRPPRVQIEVTPVSALIPDLRGGGGS